MMQFDKGKTARSLKKLFEAGFYKPVGIHDLSFFVRQLSTMLSAGVPLYRVLNTISDNIVNIKLRKTIVAIKDKIKNGVHFSECLREYPVIFPPLMVGLVKVGEVSGLLEAVLLKYADLLEWEEEFKSKLFTMLIYPAVILSFGAGVLLLIMIFVLPKFVSIFSEYKQALPLPTLILIKISAFFSGYWWLLLLLLIAAAILFKLAVNTPAGRKKLDTYILNLPFIGKTVHKAVLSRFFFLLSVMLESGVPLLEALSVASGSIDNKVLAEHIDLIAKNVQRGEALSRTLASIEFFPKNVVQMMQVGEETGKLEAVLVKAAASYERETETSARRLMILIEPLFILGVALLVGYIALALLLPIMSISAVIK
jgi:type IV pilus assembly protein PilC